MAAYANKYFWNVDFKNKSLTADILLFCIIILLDNNVMYMHVCA